MRTAAEIIARIKEVSDRDFFGFETGDLVVCLNYEDAKPFLKEGNEDWTATPHDRESIIARMKEYMPFAWDKAQNQRGLSAGRSMCHFMAWTWLAGDDLGDLLTYDDYGIPHLKKICDHYGWDYKAEGWMWAEGSEG